MKSLVIVESPAKAKTINKILGKDFGVKASIGHVKDLPKKEIGVDVENNFEPTYIIIPGKEKVIKELKSEAKKAEEVYIATDPDREGEAIAHHIAEEIKSPKNGKKIYRVTFHEITDRAVKEAIKNPGNIDINKVEAQQARRILDRLVGYNLSPFLWKKVRRGLSAGRVQSVAVKLIVDREREIESFNKEEYWTIEALLQPQKITDTKETPQQFWSRLYKYNDSLVINRDAEEGKRFLITNEETAKQIADEIKDKELRLSKIEKKLRKRSPSPPFITSTLQQEAARRLRFPAKRTMMIAQQLYEGIELGKEGSVGLITYMRTDSFRIAPEAQQWARELIQAQFGKDYLPEKPPHYKSKGSAQEAHEAIRPTYPDKSPETVKAFLSKDQYSLYSLIWNRFIASQMTPAQLEQTTFIIGLKDSGIEMKGSELRSSGTVIRFPGFMALYTESKDEIEEEEGGILPPLKENDILKQLDIKPVQHFTQPPPRYSEATLVKALEEKGIGRPSTYAAILSTIQDRKYVEKNNERRFFPTELGIVVNDLLVEKFPELIDISFTAKMEEELDEIESAKMKWVKVINDFYKPFSKDLNEASKDMEKVKPKDIPTEEVCEKCGSPMVIKWGRHGRFMACSGYPECKNTRPLDGENGGAPKAEPIATNEFCEKCGSPMVIKSGRFGKFMACSKYPECKNTKPIATGVKCPLDGGDIVERRSKRGKPFWSCGNYPKCNFASWYKPVPKQCPKCSASFLVERWTKTGESFHACSNKDCDYKIEVKREEASSEA
ncbi:MAG: type I DNA topoisomerase [Thermodesulfovibrionales bacterium]|nr:type I DNA topoisomerase [Thermodesulfovibrionales bacterium]